jgi:hypothetical protein
MRRILFLTAMLAIVLALAGCSSSGNGNQDDLALVKEELAALKEENENLRKQLEKADDDSGIVEVEASAEITIDADVDASVASSSDVETGLIVEKSKPITLEDYAEMTLVKHQFAKTIKPSKPGSFYTYYEAKEPGTTYLAFTLKIKSLLTSAQSSDEFADVSVKYDGKYDYGTFSTIEDQGGADFTYTNITSIEPLKSGTLVFLAEVPEEIENDGKPLQAFITINDQTYEYKIR